MAFQGKEFTQGMRQLVVNLKQFNDIERRQNNFKAAWTIEQTAIGLGIGEATVRRIMAEYNKNKQHIPEDQPKARGRPEHIVPKELQTVVRQYIRSQNLKGQHVSVELVRDYLCNLNSEYTFTATTLWRALSRCLWNREASIGIKGARLCNLSKKTIPQTEAPEPKT